MCQEKDRTGRGEYGPAEEQGVGEVHGYGPGTLQLVTAVRTVRVTVTPVDPEDAPGPIGTGAPVWICYSWV